MAVQTSMVHQAMNAMQEQFATLDALAGVTVVSGDLAGDTPPEAVLLVGIDDWTQEWSTTGNLRKRETFTVDGMLGVVAPGAGETAIRASRERAFEIAGAIEEYLRMSVIHGDEVDGITLQGLVNKAVYVPRSTDDLIVPDGHLCLVQFGISVEATLRRG